jgi:hypothetical protein
VARVFDLVASVPLLAFVSPTALLMPSPEAKTTAYTTSIESIKYLDCRFIPCLIEISSGQDANFDL